MSHLSQLVTEALANNQAFVNSGQHPPMHQAGTDRVQVDIDGKVHWVVCLSLHEMESIHRHLPDEVEYRDKFAV